MVSIIILCYNIIILWDHRYIRGPMLTETSLCGTYLYCIRYVEDAMSPDLTYYPLRILVCTDIASLQRLSPVAVICLKKLFWEVADSFITRSCRKQSCHSTASSIRWKSVLYEVQGAGGFNKQCNSAKCVPGKSRSAVCMIRVLRKLMCYYEFRNITHVNRLCKEGEVVWLINHQRCICAALC